MRRTGTMLAALLGLAPAACSTQAAPPAPPAETAAVHPVSGLEVIPLTITREGTVHRFRVEVARTPEEQARGLMFRTELGADEGMLFPTETPQFRSFWMKNTVIPLDLIFVGADGLISNIAAMTTPYSLDSIPSEGPVIAVLELRGGRAAELGIAPGARVAW